jgi:hypothetical protein
MPNMIDWVRLLFRFSGLENDSMAYCGSCISCAAELLFFRPCRGQAAIQPSGSWNTTKLGREPCTFA